MRPSEALALSWDDIDFDNRKINIDKSLALKGEIKTTKTKNSIRVIDMLDTAKEVLEHERERTKVFCNERVFLSQYDTPFRDYTGWSVGFNKVLEKAKINNGTLYNLRHTFASTLISKGADMLWVSKTLGHKDLNTTFKFYAKFVKPTEEERKNKITEYGTYLAQ
jgi:integrase